MTDARHTVRGTTWGIQHVARQMRYDMTPAEQCLWDAIKEKKLNGLRFRAQHAVGQFVLDFYCASCKLGIELDGSVHDDQQEQDAARTEFFAAYGYEIIRFRNKEVLLNLKTVLEKITQVASSRSKTSTGE